MSRTRAFRRCPDCSHHGVTHTRTCAFCGGVLEAMPPPADLFTGWRCDCFHCAWRPC